MTLVRSVRWIVPMQVGAYLGYLSFGFLADRVGRRRTCAAFLVAAAVLVPPYGGLVRTPLALMLLGRVLGFVARPRPWLFARDLRASLPIDLPTSISRDGDMEHLLDIVDFFMHIDRHLTALTREYGAWTYAVLFLIVFCETGLVVTPLLPGDSLLFAAGTLSAGGGLNPLTLLVLLAVAAILGDTINYSIGAAVGTRIFDGRYRIFKPEYLARTERFYEKYGGKTIVLARFVPIVRTYAPFVAGAGSMAYPRFLFYNVIGGVAWVSIFVLGGYFFGNIPIVQQNFGLVVIAIILVSFVPFVVEWVRHRRARQLIENPGD